MTRSSTVTSGCFNEAAAYHCGKHMEHLPLYLRVVASMRPQHITAENRAALADDVGLPASLQ